jgi:spermidine synthase
LNFRTASKSVLKTMYHLAARDARRERRWNPSKKRGVVEEAKEYLYKGSENGALIEVVRVSGELQLWIGGAQQTKSRLFGGYYQYWSLLPSFYKNPNILLMGLGGGTTCRIFDALYQGYHIDAVDISPAVIAVAKEYFGISESERLRIYTDDAYKFSLNPPRSYEIVIVDTFQGKSIPQHLLTKDFFVALTMLLNEDGILTVNLSGPAIRTGLSSLLSSLSNLQFTVFFLFTEARTNMLVYCLKGNVSLNEFVERLKTAAEAMPIRKQEVTGVATFMEDTLYAVKDA